MASKRNRTINLPAPYLKRVWLEPSRITDRAAYPFCLPLLRDDFELSLDQRSPLSSERMAPANPPCWKGSPYDGLPRNSAAPATRLQWARHHHQTTEVVSLRR
jgi:hypothetical protein